MSTPAGTNEVLPGDPVIFDITVTNQGNMDATAVTITDYMPTGLTLNDATWTDNADGTATLATPFDLAAGATNTVTIEFTVDADAPAGSIVNWAEISSFLGFDGSTVSDADSTPDSTNFNQD